MAIKCDWVDTGKYDVTLEAVKKAITLVMFKSALAPSAENINMGDLFGGHRIHALFDHGHKLISADV